MNRLRINRKTISKDITAGLTAAVAAIPDGMATASLAGVSPIYGLYNLGEWAATKGGPYYSFPTRRSGHVFHGAWSSAH